MKARSRTEHRRKSVIALEDLLTNEQMDFIVRTLGFPCITDEGRRKILTVYFEPIDLYLKEMGTPLDHMVGWLVDHKAEILARVIRKN